MIRLFSAFKIHIYAYAYKGLSMEGTKHDTGKSRLELIDPDWLLDVGHVLAYGASIHGDMNWKLVEQKRYIAASMRHILAILKGEYLDPDTGKPHAAHLACDSMFLHYLGGSCEITKVPRNENRTAANDEGPELRDPTSLHDVYEAAAKHTRERQPQTIAVLLDRRESR